MSKITTYIKNGIEFRRCSKCQIEKENIYEFYRAKSLGRSGFRSVCRNCENVDCKEYHKKTKSKRLKYKELYNKELRELSISLKSNPCKDCGKTFHHCAMDFDHVKGKKIENIANLVHSGKKQLFLEEVEKCELVCSNCHRVRTWNRKKNKY